MTHHRTNKTWPIIVTAMVATLALSGCTESLGLDSDSSGNDAPTAVLEASSATGWTDKGLTFDAQSSSDPDGQITRWLFDFGDGETIQVDNVDDARVKHQYAEGGEYIVTLTVTDDGAENSGALTDTAQVLVTVNEESEVEERTVYVAPTETQGSKTEWTFNANEGADRYELELEATSAIPTGSSEATIEFVAPSGEVLISEQIVVPSDEPLAIGLEGLYNETGDYTLSIQADSGTVTISGTITSYYDMDTDREIDAE